MASDRGVPLRQSGGLEGARRADRDFRVSLRRTEEEHRRLQARLRRQPGAIRGHPGRGVKPANLRVYAFNASFSGLPARKRAALDALMVISSPV